MRELGELVRTGRYTADAGAAVVVEYEKEEPLWGFGLQPRNPVGYPKRSLGKGKPLGEVVSTERFGTPSI
ncbi:MAG: hypothetical protein PVSMB3_02450 [Candidatus Dormibacteraceae bacterium]